MIRYDFIQFDRPVRHMGRAGREKDGLFSAADGYVLEREDGGNTVIITNPRNAPGVVKHLPWELVSDSEVLMPKAAASPQAKAASR